MRLLAGVALQITTDHEVEELLATAEFDIGADFHTVLALHERIETLVQVNGLAGLQALGEVVPLQHALHGDLACQLQERVEVKTTEPFAVVAHFCP